MLGNIVLGVFTLVLAKHSKSPPSWANSWKRVSHSHSVILAISRADWGEGIGLNRAHLATSNERDGGGCRDHPWAVNVVHNLLDFLADHPHTNDRV